MPYYRHKIIENNNNYKTLKCHEYGSQPPKYTWHNGLCVDLGFQAKDIERQYQLCSSSERRWNTQLSSFIFLILSMIWVIYFLIGYTTSDGTADLQTTYLNSLYASIAASAAFTGLIAVSFVIGFHHSLALSSIFVLVIGYVCPIVLLCFAKSSDHPTVHPAEMLFIWSCPLIINYFLLHLPLMLLTICGLIYSVVLIVLSGHWGLFKNSSGLEEELQCTWLFLTLFCVNIVCLCSRFYEELSSRRVFYRIGRSLIYRQHALEETLLKEVMIKSIMPPAVCNDILNSGLLHDAVLCKDPQSSMRNLPIKMMEPVSILYADLVGFTAMSSTLKASELVTLLTDLYGRFDCVAEAYNCENISILGDCYFAVSGCPEPDDRHADNCMYTGVGLIKATREFCQQRNKTIDIRVGIHTGIVLCGIVGGTKFKYDVWSNDAIVANYMESGGVPGRVHLSEKTRSFLNDHWELEEGFGAKREPELAGIKTYLLKKEFHESVIIEPKKKDLSESVVYKTIEKKRGSSITSKEFDGSVMLQCVISNEELRRGYSLLPVLHPGLALDSPKLPKTREGNILNGNSASYRSMTSAGSIHGVENGVPVSQKLHTPDKVLTQKKQSKLESVLSANQPWNLHRAFSRDSGTSNSGSSLMINPLTASFRSSCVRSDFQKHGWSNEGCMCIFSRGYLSLSYTILYFVSLCMVLLVLTNIQWSLICTVLEVITNVVVFVVMLAVFVRWKRVRQLTFVKRIHRIPYSIIPVLVVILMMISTFIAFAFTSDTNYTQIQYLFLPASLLLVQFLLHDKYFYVVQLVCIVLSYSGLIAVQLSHSPPNSAPPQMAHYGIMSATSLLITLLVIIWLKAVKSKLRFGTLHESNTELAIMKEEEKVTTQLFNTIIPKHVSDQFLSELRYSHSYENVGVIFASVTNFWDFYEEKFEGGMGCIRVLNEIIRDLDDMLSSVNDLRNADPHWRAIQKIKTIGSCYMAASGLDPVTEEQTRQGNHEHILHLMSFSFKILETIKQFNSFTFGTNFTMKIGFNYGPVTDGIIGQNKVLYDIWGDTVNTASRMMSTGVIGRIQTPAAVVPHLSDHFKCPQRRGKVAVKGKGEMVTHFCTDSLPAEQIKQNLAARAAKNINTPD